LQYLAASENSVAVPLQSGQTAAAESGTANSVSWFAVQMISHKTAAAESGTANSVSWFAVQMISHTVISPISKSVSQPVAVINCNVQETLMSP